MSRSHLRPGQLQKLRYHCQARFKSNSSDLRLGALFVRSFTRERKIWRQPSRTPSPSRSSRSAGGKCLRIWENGKKPTRIFLMLLHRTRLRPVVDFSPESFGLDPLGHVVLFPALFAGCRAGRPGKVLPQLSRRV